MANHKSSKKRIASDAKKTKVNGMTRSKTRTIVKKAEKAMAAGDGDPRRFARNAESALARAASKGVMHKNTASRKASRLAKKAKAMAGK